MHLTVQLTETEALALNQATRIGHYRSRSAAVRAALRLLFDSLKIKGDAVEMIRSERGKKRSRRSDLGSGLR